MELREEFDDLRDRFVILTIHAPDIADVAALEPRLSRLRERAWDGRDLPFPILLDGSGRTVRAFGVLGYPTEVLIDPDGHVVRGGSRARLRQELQRLRDGR